MYKGKIVYALLTLLLLKTFWCLFIARATNSNQHLTKHKPTPTTCVRITICKYITRRFRSNIDCCTKNSFLLLIYHQARSVFLQITVSVRELLGSLVFEMFCALLTYFFLAHFYFSPFLLFFPQYCQCHSSLHELRKATFDVF